MIGAHHGPGRADKPDPRLDRGQGGEAEEAVGVLIVADGHAAAVVLAVDEARDAAAQPVEAMADAVLDVAAPLGRDFRRF